MFFQMCPKLPTMDSYPKNTRAGEEQPPGGGCWVADFATPVTWSVRD